MQSLRVFRPLRSSFKLQFSPTAHRQVSSTARIMAQEFKLKDVTSLNLKNGEKKEVEVEGVEGGKVLLLKVQDQAEGRWGSLEGTHMARVSLTVASPARW